MKRAALLAVAAAAAACAPALREPPPVTVLAGPRSPEVPAGADRIALADAKWALRPDPAAVREAESLYLAAARSDETDTRGLIGAVRAKAWLVDHGADLEERAADARSAVQTAQWCGRRRPGLAACDYWLAIAVGLQAREIRQTADDGMKTMVAALERARAADPRYENAGPHRVLALVLLRAPGWPLGPGDEETGLAHARAAVTLTPEYAPNQLALGEALARTKDPVGSRQAYEKARALAAGARDRGDPDAAEWVAEAEAALSAPRE